MGVKRIEYLTFQKSLLNLLGILPPEKKSFLNICSLVAYHSIIVILLKLRLAGEIMDFVVHISEKHTWPEIVCISSITVASFSRMVIYICKKEEFHRLLCAWEEWFVEDASIEPNKKAIRRSIRSSDRFKWLTLAPVVVITTHWIVYPIATGSVYTGKRILPLRTWYPIDIYSSPTYEIVYLLQSVMSIFTTFSGYLNLATFCSFCILTCCQISQLKKKLTKIGESGTDKMPNYKQPRLTGRNKIEAEIVKCIRHHAAILRFVDKMKAVFSPILVVDFLAITVPLCFTAIEITSLPIHDARSLTWMEYFLACSLAIFIFCWGGNEITLQLSSIKGSVSEALGGDIPEDSRWKIRFMMLNSDVKKAITGGSIFVMSLETFESIIGLAISNFLIFKKLKDPEEF